MLGMLITSIVALEWKKEMDAILERIQIEEVPSLEMRHIGKEGQVIYVWISFIQNYDENKDVESVTMVVRDITTQKKIDDQMRRLEELNLVGQLAASISHEIRNPMSVVKGFLQILSEKNELALYTDYLDMMVSEINRVDSLMSEFLAFGRLNTGIMKLHNLNDIIHSLLPLLKADASKSDKQVLVELDERIPELELNENEIRQVVLNLVRNGLEAMSEGEVIKLKTYCDGDEVVLAVQDQGTGIPPQILEKLGSPFLTTKDTGTGLGLSVCYQIVAKHQATMDVNTGAQGTTFFVKFKP
jgi:signal transduction histidine kinase